MEKIGITSSTEKELLLVIDYPDVKTHKLAILCPGSLEPKDCEHLVLMQQDLVKKDYTVVRFDPTGTEDSPADMLERTTTEYLNNIKKVFEHMLSKEKYSYVVLGGHGWGAIVCILYAAMDVRISATFGIIPSIQNSHYAAPEWREENEKIIFTVPYEYVSDAAEYNLTEEIKKISGAVILIIGNSDIAVRLSDVKEIPAEMNGPKKLVMMGERVHDERNALLDIEKVNESVLGELQ
jgi:hypothetical protein